MMHIRNTLYVVSVFLLAQGCGGGGNIDADGEFVFKNQKNEVIIHELADPDRLNPVTSSSANSTYIQSNIFMYLIDVNKSTLKTNPSLAKDYPRITAIEDGEYAGGLKIEYEIRPEAVWDNGDPVTAEDVDFTLKAAKNPLVDAEHLRPYLDFLTEIVIDPENPKKFTFLCREKYFGAEFSSGGQVHIIPEHIYDPNRVMRKVSIKDFSIPAKVDAMRADAELAAFAREFNSEKFQREKGFVVGCGPYTFEKWVTGQRIVLKKKENWWGQGVADDAANFEAYPDRLVHEIVNDWTTTVTAMKDESIDLARGLQPKDFTDLGKNERFLQRFELYDPTYLSYVYVGMHMKNPRLSDVRVRKAIAHLVDKKQVIDIIYYNLADQTIGPFHPSKPYYNKNIQPYDFNVAKANQLLDEAGWIDSDKNGIRDRVIDGKKTELALTYKYNSGNQIREQIGLYLQESAKGAGIDIDIITKEWTVFLDETKKHNYDLYCGAWVQDPIMDDPKQLWHTDSYNGGSNYVGFGDLESDALIEAIRTEMDDEKRYELYRKFQQRINEDVPYVFIYTPRNLIGASKRFDNVHAYAARPGYIAREFKLVSGSKMLAN